MLGRKRTKEQNRQYMRKFRAKHPNYYKTPYWREKQREARKRYLQRHGMKIQRERSLRCYYKKHEEKKVQSRAWMKRFRDAWRGGLVCTKERQVEAEVHVAQEVLPHYGFTDIFLTRPYNAYLPFDIIATNGRGERSGIDVTLVPQGKLKTRRGVDQWPLIEHLGLKFYFLHITPNFKFHCLKELEGGQRSSSCYKEFLSKGKFMREEVLKELR